MKIDYEEIFDERVIYVTGVGRSGTTIIGKILSSMRPVYYLFEPAILRIPLSKDYDTLRRNVFEDYFLPQIHGRCNPNPNDWSYWGNQFEGYEIEHRWEHLRRRNDALELIEKEEPYWIIKNPEAQPLAWQLSKVFPGVKFVNVQRNGLDVVASCLERGWFTDDYQPIEPADEWGKPWYISTVFEEQWESWNQATRAACNWRVLSEMDIPAFNVRYEDFIAHPYGFVEDVIVEFGLEKMSLTEMHLKKVKNWKQEVMPKVKIEDIMEPERIRFLKTMEKLGYQT